MFGRDNCLNRLTAGAFKIGLASDEMNELGVIETVFTVFLGLCWKVPPRS